MLYLRQTERKSCLKKILRVFDHNVLTSYSDNMSVICSSSFERRYLISVSFLERFNSISDEHPLPVMKHRI